MARSACRILMAACGLLGSGCGPGTELSAAVAVVPPQTALTEVSRLAPADEIDGVDLAREPDGTLHVVWRERIGDDPSGLARIVHRRGSGRPLRWSLPRVLPASAGAAPQITAGPDGVHVVAGARLRHWLLPADGGDARDLGELLDEAAPGADAVDMVARDGSLIIVYRTAPLHADPVLHAVRWGPHGRSAPQALGRGVPATAAGRANPQLHAVGPRLLAVWTVVTSSPAYDAATRVTTFRTVETVLAAWSSDGGRTWSRPGTVAATSQSDIPAIAVTAASGIPVVFHATRGLFASRREGGGWTPSAPVFDAESARSADVTAVAAGECGARPAVAWVDARHRRSDRSLLNPLGGFPWSDDPEWDNNDLFVLVPAVRDAPVAQTAGRRLTEDGSYTGQVAMARDGDELVIVHAGRARIGKSRHDADAPPRVVLSRIPCG